MAQTSTLLPDLTPYPPSEEKAAPENLGEKLELLIPKLSETDSGECETVVREYNETWWKANEMWGKLLWKTFEQWLQESRFQQVNPALRAVNLALQGSPCSCFTNLTGT